MPTINNLISKLKTLVKGQTSYFDTWNKSDIYEFLIDLVITGFNLNSKTRKSEIEKYDIVNVERISKKKHEDVLKIQIKNQVGDVREVYSSIHKDGRGRYFIYMSIRSS